VPTNVEQCKKEEQWMNWEVQEWMELHKLNAQ